MPWATSVSFLNLLWVPLIILFDLAYPAVALTVPVLTAVFVNVVHAVLLYGHRVRIPKHQIAGAAVAAMSLQLTVARAVLEGMIRDGLPFKRTEKGGLATKKRADRPAPDGNHPRHLALLWGRLAMAGESVRCL